MQNRRITETQIAALWKQHLQARDYRPATINAMLIALNRFFDCMHWQDCQVKTLELQRRLFRSADRDLTRSEYISLIETARQCDKDRTYLLVKVFALLEPAL